ncbi:hypothetical cytosolic protein [Syntrophus aciditrophicus SB]|uniref:Hypothetical cytosolic protein n=1 Tax=Syntrophus aciditrophicus (strain SB) TaxID=56780 RepID=Q2LX19_SYNAS|nr:hypothetical cytosolic protein [Syntrophus aciditrophicus SB]
MIAAHARNLDLLHDVAPFVSPYPYFMDRIEKSEDKKNRKSLLFLPQEQGGCNGLKRSGKHRRSLFLRYFFLATTSDFNL